MRHSNAVVLVLALALSLPLTAPGQHRYFLGGGPGGSILSGGSGTEGATETVGTAVSNYEPRLGPMGHVFAGGHLGEYMSAQGVWSYSRNRLTMNAASTSGAFYRQQRDSSQHNIGGDLLVYFRNRGSRLRPFLSVGVGYQFFESEQRDTALVGGIGLTPPPQRFTVREPGLRVAAGADLVFRNGWGLRYAFLEILQSNGLGRQVTPKATAPLMHFQHVVGFFKQF